jgi:glycosyltransferase involved in cell wall biosynthesis
MKISYFSTHFPYKTPPVHATFGTHYGGAENVAHNLALNMVRRGHQVSVFTTSADSNDAVEEEDGLKVYHCGTNFRVEKGYFSVNLFRKPLQEKQDIIHAHISTPPADLSALLCAIRTKTPLVVTYHGDGEVGYGKLVRRAAVAFYNTFLLHRVLSKARVIICPSEYYLEQSRFLGRYGDKVIAIHNGVNLEDFNVALSKEDCRRLLGLPADSKLILFVGELIEYKGPDVLVKAMAHIVRKVPNAQLVFLGDGTMKNGLQNLTQSLGLAEQVKFAGFIGGDVKARYYKAADLLCLPSTMGPESFGIVLLEAWASGLPIVVSDLPTFKSLVEDGHNGIVTLRRDDQSLASGIVRLLEDEGLRHRMGRRAYEKAEQFSWDGIAKETEKVYERMLA